MDCHRLAYLLSTDNRAETHFTAISSPTFPSFVFSIPAVSKLYTFLAIVVPHFPVPYFQRFRVKL